jgi:hypothetical protein
MPEQIRVKRHHYCRPHGGLDESFAAKSGFPAGTTRAKVEHVRVNCHNRGSAGPELFREEAEGDRSMSAPDHMWFSVECVE